MAGYWATIAPAFKHTGLLDVGHDRALTALLASFSRENSKTTRVLPQWDSSLVLMAFTRAPFEPLQMAVPRFLAWKVFFLTLLPSGARRKELHAIMARSIQHDNNGNSSLCPLIQVSSPRHNYAPKEPVLLRSWLSQLSCAQDQTCLRIAIFVWSELARSTWLRPSTSTMTRIYSSSPTRRATKETFTRTLWWDLETDSSCLQGSRGEVLPQANARTHNVCVLAALLAFGGQCRHGGHSISLLMGFPINFYGLVPQGILSF